jgi:ubiquitin carboxyl-terminal hydrolase 5/13
MNCFNGGCPNHASQHSTVSNHPIVLVINKTVVPGEVKESKTEKKRFELPPFENKYSAQARCLICNLDLDMEGAVKETADIILEHQGVRPADDFVPFVEEYLPCMHSGTLEQIPNPPILEEKGMAHCEECEVDWNLWLCLTCGHLGCSRSQSARVEELTGVKGGNSHAEAHFNATGHPLVVRMGTITAEGKGEVNCYASKDSSNPLTLNCNNIVEFPNLAKYLNAFGISVEGREATETTLAETTSSMLDAASSGSVFLSIPGDELKSYVFGPRHTGLRNIGNSCYMASSLQMLFALPSMQTRYAGEQAEAHLRDCKSSNPSKCYRCQMSKLGLALTTGTYSPAPSEEQLAAFAAKRAAYTAIRDEEEAAKKAGTPYTIPEPPAILTQHTPPLSSGVAPRMFKGLLCRDHEDFKTSKQQDAIQFVQWFLDQIRTREKHEDKGADPTEVFDFSTEERLECSACHAVKYRTERTNTLMLPVPMPEEYVKRAEEERRANLIKKREEEARKKAEAAEGKEPSTSPTEKKEEVTTEIAPAIVPFETCMGAWSATETVTYTCPVCQTKSAEKSTRMKTFPDVLIVQSSRWDHTGWVPKKLNVSITVPLDPLDLGAYRGTGLQEGETAMPESKAAPAAPRYDAALVSQMGEMGLPANLCKNALIACNNDYMQAVNWAFEHSADPGVNDPPPEAPTSGGEDADPREATALATLTEFGFGPAKFIKFALKKTNYDLDRAITFLSSHDPSEADGEAPPPVVDLKDDAPARFQLIGFITHLGNRAQSGHYVAHLREPLVGGEPRWLIYNDSRVMLAETPPADQGYIYFFKRLSD